MGGGPLPAQGGIQILGNAEAGAPLWFATSLSSHTAWWFASAFSCATETARTVQTVQKTSDFTGAVLGDVSTTGVMVQTVQKTVWRCRVRRGCGRPCGHAATSGRCLRSAHR